MVPLEAGRVSQRGSQEEVKEGSAGRAMEREVEVWEGFSKIGQWEGLDLQSWLRVQCVRSPKECGQ